MISHTRQPLGTHFLSLPFLFPLLFLQVSPPSRSPVPRQPAPVELSQPRYRSYILLSALTTCVLTEHKIGYEMALKSTAASLFTLIRDLHGGRVSGMQTSPQPDVLTRFLSFQISATTMKVCRGLVPPNYVKLVEGATVQLQQKSVLSPRSLTRP